MAVEGFSDKAFPDGGGVPTIGSGTTFYLDENGRETKVKMGDEISADEAMEHKWRYINKYMIETLGDDFGRACTEKEAMAGIGAGVLLGAECVCQVGIPQIYEKRGRFGRAAA